MPSPPECVQTACSKQQGQVILGSSYEWGEKVCLLNYSVYVWVGGCVCVFVCVCVRVCLFVWQRVHLEQCIFKAKTLCDVIEYRMPWEIQGASFFP